MLIYQFIQNVENVNDDHGKFCRAIDLLVRNV